MYLIANPITAIVLGFVAGVIIVWVFRFWPTPSLMPRIVLGPILSVVLYSFFAWPFGDYSIMMTYAFIPVGPISAILAPIIILLVRHPQVGATSFRRAEKLNI